MEEQIPRLRVVEQFVAIQGEGILTGVPSRFLRLAGCNLKCRYCDTKFASWWDPEGEWWTVPQLRRALLGEPLPTITLTGGEPLLWAKPLSHLLPGLKAVGKRVVVETNGTLFDETLATYFDLVSLSPKLPHFLGPDAPLPLDTLDRWLASGRPCQIKLVIADAEDLDRAADLLLDLGEPAVPVILQPNGLVDSLSLYLRSARELTEAVLGHPVLRRLMAHMDLRVMLQQHRLTHAHQRGT